MLAADAAALEARGLALRRDKQACLAALCRAELAFAAADRTDVPPWQRYYMDESWIAGRFAYAFLDLGQPREAEPFARRSLQRPDGHKLRKQINLALLASILAEQRRVEEACDASLAAVHMAHSVRSVRGTDAVADVARRLAPFRSNADVQALYEHMIDTGIPVPPT